MTASPTSSKRVTVSIVSHGQQALILPLMQQLHQHCGNAIRKVVLTVNIPEPDLVQASGWHFDLEYIINVRPFGFGANHNAAFRNSSTEWFLVLNPDIRIEMDILTPLLMQAAEQSGVLAPRIIEPGKRSPEPHRDLITPSELVRRRQASHCSPHRPAWIPGMFMLFRASAYREIGGFDERYFMYGEDFDICARLRLSAWQLQINEQLVVEHQAQRSSSRSAQHFLWHFRSLLSVWTSGAFWKYRRLLSNHRRHEI